MARIIYALSGQGRGHTSRSLAMSESLRKKGHEVHFCCAGTALEIMESRGESVIPVPLVRQVVHDNTVLTASTLIANWPSIRKLGQIVTRLSDAFSAYDADLLITDFEAFSWRAADRLRLPVVSFNHQQIVTETEYDFPISHRYDARVAKIIIKMIAPRNPERLLLTSFFFPPVKRPQLTSVVPPIIRQEVVALDPVQGEHVLVYYNQPEGSRALLDLLRRDGGPYIVYNFPPPPDPTLFPNIIFKSASINGFLADLAKSRAVLCTAGFTLISEALYLGKPLLAVPNGGIFEQTLNAIFLEREGLGKAVIGRHLSADDLLDFRKNLDMYAGHLQDRPLCGNNEAISFIEDVLSRVGPSVHSRPRRPTPPLESPALRDVLAGGE